MRSMGGRFQPHAAARAPAGRDARLAGHRRAVRPLGPQPDLAQGRGQDPPVDAKDLRALLDGQVEAAGHLGQRGQEQVPEGMAGEVAVPEAVLEEPAEERLVVGEGDETGEGGIHGRPVS